MTSHSSPPGDHSPQKNALPLGRRAQQLIFGPPRDLEDRSLFHRLSLVPILAWIGLGADGLSSSSYGPQEAFLTLGAHTYLAVGLALLTSLSVLVLSASYSRIIEEFPHGGGGYVVASKLLHERLGVVSGSALLVDYILTVAVSIAAAGDALFSFLPAAWLPGKLALEIFLIGLLVVINIRGVKESVLALTPIFVLFLLTHLVAILGGIIGHVDRLPETAVAVGGGFRAGWAALGGWGMLALFFHAYSLGGGTYTGIEAVSNGLPIMREPRVQTAKTTMIYMAVSLAFTAGGLLLCYLLWQAEPAAGKTLNAVFFERLTASFPTAGPWFVIVALASEGTLLVVAAQAGFLDGPRVLANMAIDAWVPTRYAALGERLTARNGIGLMGVAALAALLYTGGDLRQLVVMYSINVFLTFALSMLSMMRLWWQARRSRPQWKRRLAQFGFSFALCAGILAITIVEKFEEGGWLTLAVTGSLVGGCFLIKRHYRGVGRHLAKLYEGLEHLPPENHPDLGPPDPSRPTAVALVGGYGGIGIHTVLNIFRAFPNHFQGLVLVSVGVIDSGVFKGEEGIDQLRRQTQEAVDRYLALAQDLGVPADAFFTLGTDPIEAAEKLCVEVAEKYPRAVFFAGKLIFARERWYHRLLHNRTAQFLEARLQERGRTLVVLPAKVA